MPRENDDKRKDQYTKATEGTDNPAAAVWDVLGGPAGTFGK